MENRTPYESPTTNVIEVRCEPLCISGNGTESVGTLGSTLTDDDFE